MTDSDSVLSAGTKTDDHEDSIADLSNEELATLVEESKLVKCFQQKTACNFLKQKHFKQADFLWINQNLEQP